jgi:hypothetical protein
MMMGRMMKNWNSASVLGISDLFFHHFTLHHSTQFLNAQTSNAMFMDSRLLGLRKRLDQPPISLMTLIFQESMPHLFGSMAISAKSS